MYLKEFEAFALQCMMDRTFDPDDAVTLLSAFRQLDSTGSGAICWTIAEQMGIDTKFRDGESFDYEKYVRHVRDLVR